MDLGPFASLDGVLAKDGLGDLKNAMLDVVQVQDEQRFDGEPRGQRANPISAVAEDDEQLGLVEALAEQGDPEQQGKCRPVAKVRDVRLLKEAAA